MEEKRKRDKESSDALAESASPISEDTQASGDSVKDGDPSKSRRLEGGTMPLYAAQTISRDTEEPPAPAPSSDGVPPVSSVQGGNSRWRFWGFAVCLLILVTAAGYGLINGFTEEPAAEQSTEGPLRLEAGGGLALERGDIASQSLTQADLDVLGDMGGDRNPRAQDDGSLEDLRRLPLPSQVRIPADTVMALRSPSLARLGDALQESFGTFLRAVPFMDDLSKEGPLNFYREDILVVVRPNKSMGVYFLDYPLDVRFEDVQANLPQSRVVVLEGIAGDRGVVVVEMGAFSGDGDWQAYTLRETETLYADVYFSPVSRPPQWDNLDGLSVEVHRGTNQSWELHMDLRGDFRKAPWTFLRAVDSLALGPLEGTVRASLSAELPALLGYLLGIQGVPTQVSEDVSVGDRVALNTLFQKFYDSRGYDLLQEVFLGSLGDRAYLYMNTQEDPLWVLEASENQKAERLMKASTVMANTAFGQEGSLKPVEGGRIMQMQTSDGSLVGFSRMDGRYVLVGTMGALGTLDRSVRGEVYPWQGSLTAFALAVDVPRVWGGVPSIVKAQALYAWLSYEQGNWRFTLRLVP